MLNEKKAPPKRGRGRPRKQRKAPSVLKYIEGKEHLLRSDEPNPDLVPPDCEPPEYLNDDEKRYFKEAVRNLCHMKLLAVVDLKAVERYAGLLYVWQLSMQYVRKHGIMSPSQSEPAFMRTLKQIAPLILRYEAEFGFTPSSRTTLSTDANRNTNLEGDSIEAFIKSASD